jgi:hypothetical protein
MGEPCYCGDPTCRYCYPGSWSQAKREEAHENEHGRGRRDCPVCVMQRYQAKCKVAGKVFPRDLLRKAWEAV